MRPDVLALAYHPGQVGDGQGYKAYGTANAYDGCNQEGDHAQDSGLGQV